MRNIKRGFISLTDVNLGYVALVFILVYIITPQISSYIDMQSIQNAATHAKRVQKASEAYISDHNDVLISNSTATNPVIIKVNDLINAGYLPPGYAVKNSFSSTYETRVFQPVSKKLNSMTYLIGGADLSQSMRLKLAAAIGSNAGVIENGVAKGTQGAWIQNLASFGGYNPGNGTVVIAGFYNNGNLVNDYLYRKALPGHPELNTMKTALSMDNNDINDVKDLNASGWLRTNGDTGWFNDKHKGGIYMDTEGVIKTTEDTGIYSTGRITTEEYLLLTKIEVVGTACPKDGLVTADKDGVVISCQDKIWRRQNYSADAPKPLKIVLSCHAGNNSSNSCLKDVFIDLTFWRDGISRSEIKLVSQRITRWWGDGCGSCDPGGYSFSNGVITMGVNQAFVEREFTITW